ncbi:MAG: peptide/nickel transport system permease protein [Pyrococcus sp.]|uniref:ABC transporter permease subunit n=1 Tax=Pyrococcus sp. TaxID=33866 RepID=UPI0025909D88|nr:ABC transporter permease subunit [Pyrococcus sp.]MDK2870063.1 peptide/nickel transport system permease protein [Pyrococcus sp.]
MKRKIGVVLLVLLGLFVVLSNLSVSSDEIANWVNTNYWRNNPKKAYPSWYCLFSERTPTVFLKGSEIERDGFRMYQFLYNHTYKDEPSDIRFYNLSQGEKVEIVVLRPDGILVPLYNDTAISSNLTLNIDMRMEVISTISSVFNLSREEYVFTPPTKLLFSSYKGKTLKGEYVFEIRIRGNSTPFVEILGTCYGILGTDSYGRDMWVGFVKGMNNTLYFAFSTTFITVVLGALLGLLSGYFEGRVAGLLTFLLEVLIALPMLPFLVLLVWLSSTQGVGLEVEINPLVLMLFIAILSLGKFAKTVRMIVMKEKVSEYVKASISVGASSLWIIRRHIFPVIREFSFRHFTILLPKMVALVSVLGFFGLIPGTNWGVFHD